MRRIALVLLVVTAACTGGYPPDARRFMDQNCSNEDPLCACMYRAVQDEIPYDDYRRFMFENDTLSEDERRRIGRALNRLNQRCSGSDLGATPAPIRPG